MIRRIALGVHYDGSRYHGWQYQEDVTTVQQLVEQALTQVANQVITVTCAGRTDAMVHATGQVVHFNTEAIRSNHSWVFGANSNLPYDISVQWAQPVSMDFHARYSALSRTYRYIICNQPVRPGVFQKAFSWYYKPLQVDRMKLAAQHLLGEHDFNAFRGAGCQAPHAVRTIHEINVTRRNDLVMIEVTANAFVLHMVRNIVGVLTTIGAGDQDPNWALEVLHSRDRKMAGMTSPPQGLYLVAVTYPSHFGLPVLPKGPVFVGE